MKAVDFLVHLFVSLLYLNVRDFGSDAVTLKWIHASGTGYAMIAVFCHREGKLRVVQKKVSFGV